MRVTSSVEWGPVERGWPKSGCLTRDIRRFASVKFFPKISGGQKSRPFSDICKAHDTLAFNYAPCDTLHMGNQFFWLAEHKGQPPLYANAAYPMPGEAVVYGRVHPTTYDAWEARRFLTRTDCQAWIEKNLNPTYRPVEHGFEIDTGVVIERVNQDDLAGGK